MADFEVCPVGVLGFLDEIKKRSPGGEAVRVQYHPNGDWSVYDGPAPHPLHIDDAETLLAEAIDNIKIGNKTDDKSIIAELAKLGVCLARFAPAPPEEPK